MKPYEKEIVLYDTSISTKTKSRIFLNERLRLLTNFDEEFLFSIGTQNKNFLMDYMNFLAFTELTLKTCSNIRYNLILFFTWNRDCNNNKNFRQITMTQARSFFLFVKEEGYSYTRAKTIRTDLAGLGDFGEFVIGKDEVSKKNYKNQWYEYVNFWREVDIMQREDLSKKQEPNCVTFTKEKLDTLRTYLSNKHDYMGLVILDHAHLGQDILTLRIDSIDFNRDKKYSKQYLAWRERIGIDMETLPDILIMKNKRGEWMPMGLIELRAYTRMFSVFLGKEFIVC